MSAFQRSTFKHGHKILKEQDMDGDLNTLGTSNGLASKQTENGGCDSLASNPKMIKALNEMKEKSKRKGNRVEKPPRQTPKSKASKKCTGNKTYVAEQHQIFDNKNNKTETQEKVDAEQSLASNFSLITCPQTTFPGICQQSSSAQYLQFLDEQAKALEFGAKQSTPVEEYVPEGTAPQFGSEYQYIPQSSTPGQTYIINQVTTSTPIDNITGDSIDYLAFDTSPIPKTPNYNNYGSDTEDFEEFGINVTFQCDEQKMLNKLRDFYKDDIEKGNEALERERTLICGKVDSIIKTATEVKKILD